MKQKTRMKSWRTHPAVAGGEVPPATVAQIDIEVAVSPYAKPKPAKPSTRRCLSCATSFRSDGPQNRLCSTCRRLSHYLGG